MEMLKVMGRRRVNKEYLEGEINDFKNITASVEKGCM